MHFQQESRCLCAACVTSNPETEGGSLRHRYMRESGKILIARHYLLAKCEVLVFIRSRCSYLRAATVSRALEGKFRYSVGFCVLRPPSPTITYMTCENSPDRKFLLCQSRYPESFSHLCPAFRVWANLVITEAVQKRTSSRRKSVFASSGCC